MWSPCTPPRQVLCLLIMPLPQETEHCDQSSHSLHSGQGPALHTSAWIKIIIKIFFSKTSLNNFISVNFPLHWSSPQSPFLRSAAFLGSRIWCGYALRDRKSPECVDFNFAAGNVSMFLSSWLRMIDHFCPLSARTLHSLHSHHSDHVWQGPILHGAVSISAPYKYEPLHYNCLSWRKFSWTCSALAASKHHALLCMKSTMTLLYLWELRH